MTVVNKRIPLSTPTMHDEEIEYIRVAFDRNWVAPLGFNCDKFERDVKQRLYGDDCQHQALALVSATAALHLAVKLAGVKRGDVVLCSDMTFLASVNPVCYEGGIPVFVDSERETWNMDPVALEKAFEKYPQAKAVILVHLYGVPAKMDEILDICNRHNAVLIEDAAEALSSTYNGIECGTFGKYNAISFNGNKIITTSGGGMLITDSAESREKAFFWSTQSRDPAPWYQHSEVGYNYRMSNIVAGIGRGQMKHLDEHKAAKVRIYNRYKEGFKNLPVTMNPYLENTSPNFWLSCLLINKECSVDPMTVIKTLDKANIEARPIWKAMHLQPLFADSDYIYTEDIPVCEDIFARGLCLPSDIKMTEEEQDYVIKTVKSCF